MRGFIKIITNHGKHHETRLHSISHRRTPINPELRGKSLKKFGFFRQQNSQKSALSPNYPHGIGRKSSENSRWRHIQFNGADVPFYFQIMRYSGLLLNSAVAMFFRISK